MSGQVLHRLLKVSKSADSLSGSTEGTKKSTKLGGGTK